MDPKEGFRERNRNVDTYCREDKDRKRDRRERGRDGRCRGRKKRSKERTT
jgi:hypothetical protein